jgi:hypothetical protein
MSFFRKIAKPAVVALMVSSMACMAATAQAQSMKRVTVAMAPADLSPVQEATPARPSAPAITAPRAKRLAVAAERAGKPEKPECFWCNRTVYISGVTF